MLAKAAGVSLRSVQRILEAHQLAPHRIRTFKLSNQPRQYPSLGEVKTAGIGRQAPKQSMANQPKHPDRAQLPDIAIEGGSETLDEPVRSLISSDPGKRFLA